MIKPSPIPLEADLLCGHCGQNLRGVASDRCPECGHCFDRTRILGASIPWEQRRRLGRFRAYWRTVRLITFHGPALTDDAEVTLRAARSFRRWTLLLVCVAALAPILFSRVGQPVYNYRNSGSLLGFDFLSWKDFPRIFQNSWFLGTSMIALCFWIMASVGLCDWFFHSRQLSPDGQRRALARSCYSIAPLAWMPVLGLVVGVFLGLEEAYDRTLIIFYPAAAIVGTSAVLCGLCPVDYGCGVLRLLYRVHRSRRRVIVALILLPILWTVAACVIFIGLQFAVNYVALFWASVRQ